MKYFNDELDRRKFSDIAYYAYCTVHNLNELIIVETKNKGNYPLTLGIELC